MQSIAPHFIILRMVSGESSRLEASLIPLQNRGGDLEGVTSVGDAQAQLQGPEVSPFHTSKFRCFSF